MYSEEDQPPFGLVMSFHRRVAAHAQCLSNRAMETSIDASTHLSTPGLVQLNMSYCIMKIRPQSQCSTRFMHYHRGHRCVTCVTPQSTLRPVPQSVSSVTCSRLFCCILCNCPRKRLRSRITSKVPVTSPTFEDKGPPTDYKAQSVHYC